MSERPEMHEVAPGIPADPKQWNWVELPLYDPRQLTVIARAAQEGDERALQWLKERKLLSLLGPETGDAGDAGAP
jgi:hypothetical protein